MVSHALPPMQRWQAQSAWSAAACCRFVSMPKQRACPHMTQFDLAADPDGFSRAAADAALAGAKRLECGSLLPLCFYAQTTCLSP